MSVRRRGLCLGVGVRRNGQRGLQVFTQKCMSGSIDGGASYTDKPGQDAFVNRDAADRLFISISPEFCAETPRRFSLPQHLSDTRSEIPC